MENMDLIVDAVQKELLQQAQSGRASDFVVNIQLYKSLPVTSPMRNNEIALILDEVVVVEKVRTLDDGRQISIYEVFDKDGHKILGTQEDGLIKFDREILEDLIKDRVKVIEEAGYSIAGVNSMSADGKIEASFEMMNGQLQVINNVQKERLKHSNNKALVMESIRKSTPSPELDDSNKLNKDRAEEQQQQDSIQHLIESSKDELGFEISEIERVDDPIFRMNNPQTQGKDIYIAMTDKGEPKFLEKTSNSGFKEAEGFERSSNASGRTTKIVHDEDMLDDNEVNTYGEIYPTNRDGARYTIEHSRGSIKLIEQREYKGAKISKTDAWVSREVQTDNTDYKDINREGAENSKNITARTFNMSSSYEEATQYGNTSSNGGINAIGDMMKKKPTETNMESMAPNPDQRFEAAKKIVADAAYKMGASLDPDTELTVNERVKDIVYENDEKPFTEEMANEILSQAIAEKNVEQDEKDAQNSIEKNDEYNDNKNKEHEKREEVADRNRLEEYHNRLMRRGHP